ncbi:uncharacterized protein B0H18DRAFT_867541 [Fomitopsis serialis]|uniref:uncharacterized protein n=1 Tax=Fomitopsis serialis TaxID=139415 RepID=UPI002007E71F|nr:uncharacterized protein B0H18DRAFT_867541 [Neoantrodia serialis]KAH9937672.1 hypothetical protein B0H18DRAFT_867541 [Neoantrodia serialis]
MSTIPPLYPPPSATKLRRRRVLPRGSSHPYLFTLMTLTAMTELGLTAFLISAGGQTYAWASPGYYSLCVLRLRRGLAPNRLILVCFMAAWTVLFAGAYVLWALDGGVHLLANVASSVIWLLLTSVLWGAGAGLMHSTRVSSDCPESASISRCRQTVTVEALGWTEFGLCCITLGATLFWLRQGMRKSGYARDSRTFV